MKIIISLLVVFLSLNSLYAQQYEPTWESLDKRPIPTWFQDAKFGIFIHWGVYSVPAWRKLEEGRYASYAEWYYARVMDNKLNGGYDFHRKNFGEDFEYRDFAPFFKAELFDADFWAETFKKSGAKYVVLTSKHHDGFCLWPTENPHKENWNSGDIGPKRDLVGELSAAVRKKGLKMGLYYSIPDWESIPRKLNGEYYINKKYVDQYGLSPTVYSKEVCQAQLKELVIKYQPSLLFSDAGEWLYDEDFWKTKEFFAWLYNNAPNRDEVIVNDRWCKGMPGNHGDYYSSEYKDAEILNHPWEESRGIGGSYGFNRAENLNDYQSSKDLIVELIDIVSRGGNLLLNVGPTADGRIPVIMQERLQDIGNWLEINGEAIYGTTKVDIEKESNFSSDIFYTQNDNSLYAIITKWNNGSLELNLGENVKVVNVSILGTDKKLLWKQTDSNLEVEMPLFEINEIPCQHAWCFKIEINK
jgi:alpha-L-fucosidase